jgi:hypothetical protein
VAEILKLSVQHGAGCAKSTQNGVEELLLNSVS